jgi:hypothetical protein
MLLKKYSHPETQDILYQIDVMESSKMLDLFLFLDFRLDIHQLVDLLMIFSNHICNHT